jgi:type IV pilus assembly protein PilP
MLGSHKSVSLILSIVALCSLLVFMFSTGNLFAQSENSATTNSSQRQIVPPLPPPVSSTLNPGAVADPVAPPSNGDLSQGETDPTILERFPLDEFSLAAIVVSRNPENSIAMLEYNGIGYTVKKGSKIGTKNGVVKEITANSIIIEEQGTGGELYGGNLIEISLPQ